MLRENTLALVKCSDCGNDMSSSAPACPKCGKPAAVPAESVKKAIATHACIHCGSTELSFSDDKQGFGAGKALLGAVAFGPLGLFAGAINKNKRHAHIRCNSCLKIFSADQMLKAEQRGRVSTIFKCPKCKQPFPPSEKRCPSCGASRSLVPGYIFIGVLLAGIGWCGTKSCDNASAPSSVATRAPVVTTEDDLSMLVSKLGKPDVDDTTAMDNPRPPIVTRWLIYKREHLRANYIPEGVTVDDPPPYARWKFIAFTDSKTNQPLTGPALKKRLDRLSLKPAPAAQ